MTLSNSKLAKLAAAAAVSTALLGTMAPVQAADEINAGPGLSIVGAPLALHGYDPVAYFTDGAPTLGTDTYVSVHDGAAYRFASQDHLDRFEADPERYVPAYGGFCAYGVAVGAKFDGDPRLWRIEDGQLYLNLNQEIYETFLEDVPGYIEDADENWQEIEHVAVADL